MKFCQNPDIIFIHFDNDRWEQRFSKGFFFLTFNSKTSSFNVFHLILLFLDCVAHDGVHRNSTEWKPIVNGARMPCVTCRCLVSIETIALSCT